MRGEAERRTRGREDERLRLEKRRREEEKERSGGGEERGGRRRGVEGKGRKRGEVKRR